MKSFGTEEYGNVKGFNIKCNKCGKEDVSIVPVSYIERKETKKIVIELRCSCGNRYGNTIFKQQWRDNN